MCTGRCIAELNDYIEQIPKLRYIVGVSGALVYDVKEQNEIYTHSISIEQVHRILEVAKSVDAMPHILTHESIVSRYDFENMDQTTSYKPLAFVSVVLGGGIAYISKFGSTTITAIILTVVLYYGLSKLMEKKNV